MKQVGYEGNTASGKIIRSERDQVKGDSYKLLLWSGFTRNYAVDSRTDARLNQYGQGTVAHVPLSRIQPYIILSEDADVEQRKSFYHQELQSVQLPNPVIILDSNYKDVII